MIYGIGTDILRVERMAAFLERQGERGVARILSAEEQLEFAALPGAQRSRFLAKRFAVKEAFAKAMGTGIRGDVGFQSVSVRHLPSGQPILVIHDPLLSRLTDEGVHLAPHLSISDEADVVIAFVVLERV